MYRTLIGIMMVAYLLVVAYFAFRPFQRIAVPSSHSSAAERSGGAGHVEPGMALEVIRRNTIQIQK